MYNILEKKKHWELCDFTKLNTTSFYKTRTSLPTLCYFPIYSPETTEGSDMLLRERTISNGWKLLVSPGPLLLTHMCSCEYTIYRYMHPYKLKILKLNLKNWICKDIKGIEGLNNKTIKLVQKDIWTLIKKRKDMQFKDKWNSFLNILVHKTIYIKFKKAPKDCVW